MNFFASFLFLTFGLFSFSCSEPEKITKPDTLPILEVSQDAQGLWDIPGKSLFFRLYDNGFVEFEQPKKAGEANTLIQTKIRKDKFQKIITLLNSEDFQKVQNNYKGRGFCMDATLDFKINFQNNGREKIINLIGYCDIGELKNPQSRHQPGFPKSPHQFPEFPKVLSELMILVENSKWTYAYR